MKVTAKPILKISKNDPTTAKKQVRKKWTFILLERILKKENVFISVVNLYYLF